MNIADFHLSFGRPGHGWLPVQLDLGGRRYEFAASNVLNDPVHDLALGALHVLRYSEPAVVAWWLEPAWNSLVFEPMLDRESLLVSLCEDQGQRRTASSRKASWTVAPTRSICDEVARALRELLDRVGRDAYEASTGWNRPFPDEIITKI